MNNPIEWNTDSGKDDCQCLICLMRRGEAVGNPDNEANPIAAMLGLLRAAREALSECAHEPPEQVELFADDLYKTHGDVMLELFPEGVVLTTAEEINRYTLVSAIAGNLSRYAKAFLEGGDEHALREIKTFVAMLQDLDLEVQIDE